MGWPNVASMLGQRRRRWPTIKAAFAQRLLLAICCDKDCRLLVCELSAGERERGTRRDVVSDNHCDACWNFIHRFDFRKYNCKTNSLFIYSLDQWISGWISWWTKDYNYVNLTYLIWLSRPSYLVARLPVDETALAHDRVEGLCASEHGPLWI